jgi:outer membrane protein OmpA-like peptidoglycan-associated protein
MNFFISIFISGLLALFSSVSANFEFFNGTWEGQGHQADNNSKWKIKYVINGHEKKFNFLHSDLECGGVSTLQNVSKNSVIFGEKVTFGGCVDNGKTELRKIDNDTIKYIWSYKDGRQGAEGVLKRKFSLVAHYKLDGNALDASINKNHGSVFQAKSAVDRNGKSGGALSFDGVDDYVTIPNSENINFSKDQDFTVSIWVKPSPLQENTAIVYNSIVDKWALGEKGYPYVIRYWNQSSGKNHGKVQVARYDLSKTHPYTFSKKTIKDNKFHHLVYSKKGKKLYLYIDGILDTCHEDTTLNETRSTSNVQFGRQGVGKQGNGGFFKGVIDDVRFYNYSLSPIQISKLYSSVNTNPKLTEKHVCPKSVDELVEEIEELQVVDFEIPFEGNHWRIQESAKKELDKLGKVLSSNKLTSGSFELVGHVSGISGNNKICIDDNHKFVRNSRYAKECWKTDADWAMALSERRANSVKNYLVDIFSFDKNRIKAYGVGDTQHKISDSDNPENRRVEVKYIKNK